VIVRELITLLGFDLNDGPLKKYDKQIDATKEKSNMLAKAAHGVGTAYKVAAAAVAVGVGWISKNIIDATIEMEGYRSQLQAFTGDADSAASALEELRDKTIDPLFGTGTLVNAYKQLRTVGMDAKQTSAMIDVLGDVANGSAENFSMLTNTLQKVAATGKFSAMQMNQLASAGFGAADMAQALGMNEVQLRKNLEEGKIGFNELTKALHNSTLEGGRFYQNAARQAMTLSGSIKILQDVISSMGDAIGTKVLPPLVSLIRYVTDLIKVGRDGLVNFGANAFDKLIHIIYQVLIFFEVMQMRIKKLGLSFDPLKKIFQDVFGLLGTVVNTAVPVLYNLAAVIVAAFKPIQAFLSPVIEALKPIIQDVFSFAAEMIGALVPVIQGLTPYFEKLGKAVAQLLNKLRPILQNIMNAIKAAFKPIKAFVVPIIEALKPIIDDVFSMLGGVLDTVGKKTNGLAGFIDKLTPVFSELGKFVGDVIGFLWGFKDILGPVAIAIGVVTTAVWALNVALNANPIGLIIAAVAALAFGIYELVKHWDEVVEFFKGVGSKIANFFTGLWEGIVGVAKSVWGKLTEWFQGFIDGIKAVFASIVGAVSEVWEKVKAGVIKVAGSFLALWKAAVNALKKVLTMLAQFFTKIWNGIVAVAKRIFQGLKSFFTSFVNGLKAIFSVLGAFFSGLWDGIVSVAKTVWNTLKEWFGVFIETVKGIWGAITEFFAGLWEGIVGVAKDVWGGLTGWFDGLIEGIKTVWLGITEFFSALWEGIKNLAAGVWEGIKNIVIGVVDGIKNVWNGLVSFFSGLWEAIKQGPTAVVEYISNIFTNLWASITEKFSAFINTIKDGWEKVKGFFGGVIEGAVNFVTGGGEDKGTGTKPVNDLIVTPEGQYSTHPDDYIMAMQEPSSLMDTLARFLGQGGMQPAYAGGPADNSLVGSAIREKAQQNTYNNTNTSNTTKIDSKADITVNVPSGTTAEQAASIARQVDQAVKDSLSSAIGGARGTIPSPEARRL
jgi:tape measure domain-containing protein